MKLKKIELIGFKSFCNRTELAFEPGITCIVGPNGCGKSNVVDSIYWVLGTLSSKQVRGDEMLDVIFKGTETTPPMSFAQITLTIDNSDRSLPVDFNEVSISRKIYRSAECEYFINKAICRLKDVKDLLYNTGLGVDNYSIIEQGKIESLILASSKERRHIFDEAAGISKYKAKRKEAQSRLEKVNNDLLRLHDVLAEVSSQLHSVRIQAGRARKYLEMQQELKDKKTQLFIYEYKKLDDDDKQLKQSTQELEKAKMDLSSKKQSILQSLENLRTNLSEVNEKINQINLSISQETSREAHLKDSIARISSYIQEQNRYLDDRKKRSTELERKLHDLRSVYTNNIDQQQKIQSRLHEYTELLLTQQDKLQQATTECEKLANEIEAKKNDAFDLARKETNYTNELTSIETEQKAFLRDLDRVGETIAKEQEELTKLSEDIATITNKKENLSSEIKQLMQKSRDLEDHYKNLDVKLKETSELLEQHKSSYQSSCAKRDTLNELEKKSSGVGKGTALVTGLNIKGIKGIVADFVEIDDKYIEPISLLLDDWQSYIVAEGLDPARQAVDIASSQTDAGVKILVTAQHKGRSQAAELPQMKGLIGKTSEFVKITDPELEELLGEYLDNFLLVDTRQNAYEIATKTDLNILTLDGVIIRKTAIELRRSAGYEQAVIYRRAVLRKLSDEIEQIAEKMDDLSSEKRQLEEEHTQIKQQYEDSRRSLYGKSVQLRETTDNYEGLKQREAFIRKEIETLQEEEKTIKSQIQTNNSKISSLKLLLEELKMLKQRFSDEIKTMEQTLTQYFDMKQKLQDELNSINIELATIKERRIKLEHDVLKQKDEIANLESDMKKVSDETKQIQERVTQNKRELEQVTEELSQIDVTSKESKASLVSLNGQIKSLKESIDQSESELADIQKKLDQVEGSSREYEIKSHELRVNIENLLKRVQEELQVDPVRYLSNGVDIAGQENKDTSVLSDEINQLKDKIAGFGAVNMLALERLKELEERELFLSNQQKDLLNARKELTEFIENVNKESEKLFSQVINKVRAHFNEIFRKIFGGGKADIIIEKEEGCEPLDEGIEVMARLPKKEITKLLLMSGGEKSLTAIALTLALFKVKPSAFCVLDEVDAALDEVNIDKFVSLIKEFSMETQFIVITHNKKSMLVADKIYGITMQPPGISRKVSVKFEKTGELIIPQEEQAMT